MCWRRGQRAENADTKSRGWPVRIGGRSGRRTRLERAVPAGPLPRSSLSFLLFVLCAGCGLIEAAKVGGKSGNSRPSSSPRPPQWQDHAVVAVTVDGHVHTLDAWTGNVRGVYADSGGPLVSSSTIIGGGGGGDSTGGGDGAGSDSDGEDSFLRSKNGRSRSSSSGSSFIEGKSGSGEGEGDRWNDDDDDDARDPQEKQKQQQQQRQRRNALGEGFVVPGLDGVIYSLGVDGRLSVLMSSAPDLVLEPRMACLTINADSQGIVEDESCGLLIGEKTTELFSLDTETGNAKRVGGGGVPRRSSRGKSEGGVDGVDGTADEGEPLPWGQQQQGSGPGGTSQSNLLLQRDEYVVRALDAATSEELWFVTVAHFSALDLEGRGGASALTRAKVAAVDREGYTRAVRARSDSSDNLLLEDDAMKTLPLPSGHDDSSRCTDCDWSWIETDQSDGSESPAAGREDDDVGRRRGGDGWQSEGGGRRGSDEAHIDRFPYLLYENNEFVVAMDPLDGSVLWRRQMPALAVSLYGIRGREWVDIMPPPMSMLHPSLDYFPGASSTTLVPQSSLDGSWLLGGEEINWTLEPLLMLENGDAGDGGSSEGTLDEDEDDDHTCIASSGDPLSNDSDGACLEWEDADIDHKRRLYAARRSGDDRSSRSIGSRNSGDDSTSSVNSGDSTSSQDDGSHSGSAGVTVAAGNSLVPAVISRPPTGKVSGLLQPGLRQGGHLQAQLGFMNGHFFVSSSLRRGPLHAAAEDPAVVAPDRYPHPLGMASRRSLVDTAGRGLGGDSGSAATGSTGVGAVSSSPLPLARMPSRAARPTEGSERRRYASDRSGSELRAGERQSIGGGDAGGGSVGRGDGPGGNVESTKTIGIEDWRQALRRRVERDMMEGRGKGRTAGVKIQPDKEGLFMSWQFVAAMVGVVSVIVAGVAYMAYKHGAEAMQNMSTIARKRSSLARMNVGGGPLSAGVGNRDGNREGDRSTISATPRRGDANPRPMAAIMSPPLHPKTPSLHHGASASAMIGASTPWAAAATPGAGKHPFDHLNTSQDALLMQRARSGQMQRVHSLPALRQPHSPLGLTDRRRNKEAWRSLFSPEEVTNGVMSSDVKGDGGALVRAVSNVTGRSSREGSKSEYVSEDADDCVVPDVLKPALDGTERPADFSKPAPNRGDDKKSGRSSSLGDVEKGASSPTTTIEGFPSAAEACAILIGGGSGGVSARCGADSRTTSDSAKSYSSPSQEEVKQPSGSRRETKSRSSSASRNSAVVADAGSTQEAEAESGLSGRRRRGKQQRLQAKAGRESGRGRHGDDIGEEDGPRTGRRGSRSPRASIVDAEAEELIVDGGGGGGWEDGEDGDTGEDTPSALLVTNRRLRTEFIEGQKLGKGGFGTVYKCRNRLDGHDYAIKKIRLSSDRRWQPQLAKVLREVKIMSLLDHPNIVRYYQAWLEKFTEEDEELLREESAPSAVSESWDVTTGASRTSRFPHTGTTNATVKANSQAGKQPLTLASDGNPLHGVCNGVYAPDNPLVVAPIIGGGELRRSDASGSGLSDWHNWSASPNALSSKVSRQLFEEQSVDGWSVDSGHGRHPSDGAGWGGENGGWRRAWGGFDYFTEGEGEEGDDDEDEDEDEDETSLPGFVFDREEGDVRRDEKGDVVVGEKAGDDGGKGDYVESGIGSGGMGVAKPAWTEIGERRLSSSASAAATAPPSSFATEEFSSENRTEAGNPLSPPSDNGSRRRESASSGGDCNEESSIEGNGCGEESAHSDEPSHNKQQSDSSSSHGSSSHGSSSDSSSDSDDGRGAGSVDDDDSFNWDRAKPLPSPADLAESGANQHADDTDTRRRRRRPVDEDAGNGVILGDNRSAKAVKSPDSSDRNSCPTAERRVDRRNKPVHRSEGAGRSAAAAIAAEEAQAADKKRPRGKSWPQNTTAAGAAGSANAGAGASAPTAGVAGATAAGGKSGMSAFEGRKRNNRASASAALPPSARKQSFRKGGWDKRRGSGFQGRGRGRERGRGRSREVYDLWLYIQMQYCSQNNLQYFLEENPDRRSQTRVDMPQVMHIFLQVAKGLQYVHACGLIHRDLKPANCFLMAEGTVKIGDFGLSRHVLPAGGINGGAAAAAAAASAAAAAAAAVDASAKEPLVWKSENPMECGGGGDDLSITGGVGTYLYASPEQLTGQGYDEKTDVYSLGMLLFEMCHPPFDTKMERTVVLTNAHRLIFPARDVWGPPKGQEAIKNLCRSMLQEASGARPSAADIVRQVELMQGKHMLLQLDKKPPRSYGEDDGGRPDMAVVLRVEALEQEGLLHRLVDRIRALCKGQEGHDARRSTGTEAVGGGGGARLEQYGLRGHTGSAVMEFLVAGAELREREAIIAALESLSEVKSVREFPANG